MPVIDVKFLNNHENKDIFTVTKLKFIKKYYNIEKNKINTKHDDSFFDYMLPEKIQNENKNQVNNNDSYDFIDSEKLNNDVPQKVVNVKKLIRSTIPKSSLLNKINFFMNDRNDNHATKIQSNLNIFDVLSNGLKIQNIKNLKDKNIHNNINLSTMFNNQTRDSHPNNIEKISIDARTDSDDSEYLRQYDQKKVINLGEWEKHKLFNNLKYKSHSKNKDLESLNRMNEIRGNLSKIDKKNMTSLLNEFYKKNEIEQGTILMSNINLGKKSFNFEIFQKKDNKRNIDENLIQNYKKINNINESRPRSYNINILNSSKSSLISNFIKPENNEKHINETNTKNINLNLINDSKVDKREFENNFTNLQEKNNLKRPKSEFHKNNSFKPNSFTKILTNSSGSPLKPILSIVKQINSKEADINAKNLDDFIKTKNLIKELNRKKEEDFLLMNDIKVEGDLEFLSNIDLYRKVIKEKMDLEKSYRKELMIVVQQMQKRKYIKNKLNNECILNANNLQNIRTEYNVKIIYNISLIYLKEKKEQLETHKKELDKILGTKMSFLNISTSIESSQSKESPIRLKKEERVQQIFELQKLIQQTDSELLSLNKEYENTKIKYLNSIQDKRIILKTVEEELKELKINMNHLLEDQRKYYVEILQKGIDSRREGLSWIVKKLIELNTQFDYSMFPRFLEYSQIEFLMDISYKQIECYQLKIIFKALKKNQKKFQIYEKNHQKIMDLKNENNSNKSVSNKCNNPSISAKNTTLLNYESKTKDKVIKNAHFFSISFTNKLIKVFETIIRNNQKLTKNSQETKIDDLEVQMIYIFSNYEYLNV